jgi:hypothetical protein
MWIILDGNQILLATADKSKAEALLDALEIFTEKKYTLVYRELKE